MSFLFAPLLTVGKAILGSSAAAAGTAGASATLTAGTALVGGAAIAAGGKLVKDAITPKTPKAAQIPEQPPVLEPPVKAAAAELRTVSKEVSKNLARRRGIKSTILAGGSPGILSPGDRLGG